VHLPGKGHLATFALEVGDSSSVATVALPARVLLEQLGEVHPTGSRAKSKELLQAQLSRVPVEVALRLTPVRVLPSKILDLAVGDILPIPHPKHRPLDLAVDGLSLARAAVGSNGSRLACIIIESKEKPR
jgi:flagellar motor switch protein FliM